MRKDSSFSIGDVYFHWIHYPPRPVKEPWKFGFMVGKNPSSVFGKGVTIDFYVGQHVYVFVISREWSR